MSLLAYKCAFSVSFKIGKDNNQRRKVQGERSQGISLAVTRPNSLYGCSQWLLNVKPGFLGKSRSKNHILLN